MKAFFLALFLAVSVKAEPVYLSCAVLNNIEAIGGVTSNMVLPQNVVRKCLLVYNKGSAPIYVTVDNGQQGVTTAGLPIPGGGSWEPVVPPVNSIWITGAQPYMIWEGK